MRTTKCRRCAALDLLGLGRNPTKEEIKERHHLLVKVWHADHFGYDASLQATLSKELGAINAAHDDVEKLRCQCVEEEPPRPPPEKGPPVVDFDDELWQFSDEEIRQKEARTRTPDRRTYESPGTRETTNWPGWILALVLLGSIAAWFSFTHQQQHAVTSSAPLLPPVYIMACTPLKNRCLCSSRTVFYPSGIVSIIVVASLPPAGRTTVTFANGREQSFTLLPLMARYSGQPCEIAPYRIPSDAGAGFAQVKFAFSQGGTQQVISTAFRVDRAPKARAKKQQDKPAALPQETAPGEQ